MQRVFSKLIAILVGVGGVFVQVANLFLGNIIVFNATNETVFDWKRLLQSKLFWGMSFAEVVYYIILWDYNQKANEADDKVNTAITKNQVKLMNLRTKRIRQNRFEDAEKITKQLAEIEKERGSKNA